MSILDRVQFPESDNANAVKAYLRAQEARRFDDPTAFLDANIVFNGLVLNATGAQTIAEEMNRFLPAVERLSVDVAVQVEAGASDRFMVLYQFQIAGQPASQPLCDHITARGGRIVRVDNIFDASQLPAPS